MNTWEKFYILFWRTSPSQPWEFLAKDYNKDELQRIIDQFDDEWPDEEFSIHEVEMNLTPNFHKTKKS